MYVSQNKIRNTFRQQWMLGYDDVHLGKTRLYKYSKTVSCDFNWLLKTHFI